MAAWQTDLLFCVSKAWFPACCHNIRFYLPLALTKTPDLKVWGRTLRTLISGRAGKMHRSQLYLMEPP